MSIRGFQDMKVWQVGVDLAVECTSAPPISHPKSGSSFRRKPATRLSLCQATSQKGKAGLTALSS